MTSGVPWRVEGVRPQARESAYEAARRSGMSVGEWLDWVIIDRAGQDEVRSLSERLRGDPASVRPEPPERARVDPIASPVPGGADLFSTLEERIASLAEALESRGTGGAASPGDPEAVVSGLADKLERLEFARADQAAVGRLEDRIASLIDMLETSSSRLDQLEHVERGLSDVLASLGRREQSDAVAAATASLEVNSLRRDMQQTQDSLGTMRGALGDLIDRLAMIEDDARSASAIRDADRGELASGAKTPAGTPAALLPSLPPVPAMAASGRAAARAGEPAETLAPPAPPERRPIDPNLPPDYPLEPGAGRGRAGSPGERIAASEAALGPVKPPVIPDRAGGKADFIAAARRAAQASSNEASRRGEMPAASAAAAPAVAGKAPARWGGRVRFVLVAASVVVIVLSSQHLVASLLARHEPGSRPPPFEPSQSSPKDEAQANVAAGPANPSLSDPSTALLQSAAPGRSLQPAPVADPAAIPTPFGGPPIEPQPPAAVPVPAAPVPAAPPVIPEQDVTGALGRPMSAAPALPAGKPAAALQPSAPRPGGIEKLPAAIGGALRAAAAEGDPNAQFEIGQRFADGRGVPQNPADAADWYERAAKQGLVPARFRLGGLYEKGFGVKKDLDAARRLYTAAAEAGNAKAMHNLAVLYAEGIDGKPDYATAARWFRKAADYGMTDSQFNLGILYARGVGVEASLAQAYKWFSLAARDGDREAGIKRDDMASRLDQQSLAAAELEAQSFTPLEQPAGAVQVFVPSGGWDAGTPVPGSSKPRASGSKAEPSSAPAR
jgi:localization factor PodJL